jgi:Glycosyl hydrolase family 9
MRGMPNFEGPKWTLETYDMNELLGKAFYFFECQETGKLRKGHRVKWRGDSYLHDGKKEGLDLSGGWLDAGGARGRRQCWRQLSAQACASWHTACRGPCYLSEHQAQDVQHTRGGSRRMRVQQCRHDGGPCVQTI